MQLRSMIPMQQAKKILRFIAPLSMLVLLSATGAKADIVDISFTGGAPGTGTLDTDTGVLTATLSNDLFSGLGTLFGSDSIHGSASDADQPLLRLTLDPDGAWTVTEMWSKSLSGNYTVSAGTADPPLPEPSMPGMLATLVVGLVAWRNSARRSTAIQ